MLMFSVQISLFTSSNIVAHLKQEQNPNGSFQHSSSDKAKVVFCYTWWVSWQNSNTKRCVKKLKGFVFQQPISIEVYKS